MVKSLAWRPRTTIPLESRTVTSTRTMLMLVDSWKSVVTACCCAVSLPATVEQSTRPATTATVSRRFERERSRVICISEPRLDLQRRPAGLADAGDLAERGGVGVDVNACPVGEVQNVLHVERNG